MTITARIYRSPPRLERQIIGDLSSLEIVCSPNCVRIIIRTSRGCIQ
jgi:hypothetical protein